MAPLLVVAAEARMTDADPDLGERGVICPNAGIIAGSRVWPAFINLVDDPKHAQESVCPTLNISTEIFFKNVRILRVGALERRADDQAPEQGSTHEQKNFCNRCRRNHDDRLGLYKHHDVDEC